MKIPRFNTDKILSKVMSFGDRIAGHSARKYESTADALRQANSMGLKGARKVSDASVKGMDRLAKAHRSLSTKTRIKAGVGTAVAGTAGFLGLHKYHQHKDDKIMAKINSMYDLE